MSLISTTFRRLGALLPPLLLVGAILAGCEDSSRPAAEAPPVEGEPIAYDLLGIGANGFVRDTTELVIQDEEVWAAYSDSLRPIAPFRTVTFPDVSVLLIVVPQQTSGYSVDLLSVEAMPDSLEVRYQINRPGIDCLTASAPTAPFVAAIIPHTETPARFVSVVEDYSCTGRRNY